MDIRKVTGKTADYRTRDKSGQAGSSETTVRQAVVKQLAGRMLRES